MRINCFLLCTVFVVKTEVQSLMSACQEVGNYFWFIGARQGSKARNVVNGVRITIYYGHRRTDSRFGCQTKEGLKSKFRKEFIAKCMGPIFDEMKRISETQYTRGLNKIK